MSDKMVTFLTNEDKAEIQGLLKDYDTKIALLKDAVSIYDFTNTEIEAGTLGNSGENNDEEIYKANNIRTVSFLQLNVTDIPLNISTESGYNLKLFFFDETQTYISSINKPSGYTNIPENAKYMRYRIQNTNGISVEDINNVTIEQYREVGVLLKTPSIRWCAMGDSITEGWYSYTDESGNGAYAFDADKGWVTIANKILNFVLTNNGVGGTGYVQEKNGSDNARQLADTIDFSNFDLVTLAYGINDWKYNTSLGTFEDNVQTGGTIYSNMRYVIEKILNDNPVCKIIVITPLNCSRFGTEATNWGLGYAFSNNGTLEQIFNAEKTVCDYYGIEYIDMTHFALVNRKNIKSLLLDNVHPSVEAHKILGHELAAKINIR